MSRVLVSGASGIVGYGIAKSLKLGGNDHFVLGTSIHKDTVAAAFCDKFELAPRTDDECYTEWLLTTIEHYSIDFLFPGIEADVYRWNELRTHIERTGAKPLLNDSFLLSLCRNKWHFYCEAKLRGINCLIPSSIEKDFKNISQAFGVPFLLKPKAGYASKGIVRIHDENQFLRFHEQIGESLFAQPIVGCDEEEFTIAVFGDGFGDICSCIALQRTLSPSGHTQNAKVANFDPFKSAVQECSSSFQPIGPTNFQFRLEAGKPKLLEINPRISSSTSIRAAFGYNEALMSVEFLRNGKLPTQPQIHSGTAIRYVEDMIIYDSRNTF